MIGHPNERSLLVIKDVQRTTTVCNMTIYYTYDIVGRELTDVMLYNLSRRMSSPGQLRTLATKGLGLKQHILDKHLHNERDINEAALKALREWRLCYQNSAVAYRTLCEILNKVKMSSLICDTLEGDSQ